VTGPGWALSATGLVVARADTGPRGKVGGRAVGKCAMSAPISARITWAVRVSLRRRLPAPGTRIVTFTSTLLMSIPAQTCSEQHIGAWRQTPSVLLRQGSDRTKFLDVRRTATHRFSRPQGGAVRPPDHWDGKGDGQRRRAPLRTVGPFDIVPGEALAEDTRFELVRGCPQHAFQACALGL
jgi:hypothetical protein